MQQNKALLSVPHVLTIPPLPGQDAYCGRETQCRITGLHFNTRYKCRVKGYNSTGDGQSSDVVSLRTTDGEHVMLMKFGPRLSWTLFRQIPPPPHRRVLPHPRDTVCDLQVTLLDYHKL